MLRVIGILTAMLLAACAGDKVDDNIVPAADGFPIGKWKGKLVATDGSQSLVTGVREIDDGYEVVFAIDWGPATSVPARLEGETLVLEAFSLRDSASTCSWNSFDFKELVLRVEDGRLEGEANILYTTRRNDGGHAMGASRAVLAGDPFDGVPALTFVDTDDWWHSPVGIFTNSVDQPVLLPAEATIHVGGERITAAMQGAGTWEKTFVITPTRVLPWGTVAEVSFDVTDTSGARHTISWATPMVPAPTAEPDPLLTSLDGYLAGAVQPLPSTLGADLLGREGGAMGYFGHPWVLGFEADVPDTDSAHLEIDLVFATSDEGGATPAEPVAVTVASDTARQAAPLVIEEITVRPPSDRSHWTRVEDVSATVDLAAFRGQQVFVHLADPGQQACSEPISGMTVVARVEVLP